VVLRTAQKKWHLAEHAFRFAKEAEETFGFPYGEAGILVKWAEVYRGRSTGEDQQRAERLLKDALSIYQRCSARMDIDRTKQMLAF